MDLKGLTVRGICIQILSCVAAFRAHSDNCSRNDCKVVLNHLVRKYSEARAKLSRPETYRSRATERYVGRISRDHVVPVDVISEMILARKNFDITPLNIAHVRKILEAHIILCKITPAEHKTLLPHRMPEGWNVPGHPLHKDFWARYTVTGLLKQIRPKPRVMK